MVSSTLRLAGTEVLKGMIISVILTAVAMGLRLWPLDALGYQIPYLTFYPAVMLAALIWGMLPGLFTTLLSVIVILRWHAPEISFFDIPGYQDSLVIFVLNGVGISIIRDAMIRTSTKARIAEERTSLLETIASDKQRLHALELQSSTQQVSLEAAIECMRDAVFITDNYGNLLRYNQAFADFHRFRTREECFQHLSEYAAVFEVRNLDGLDLPVSAWPVSRALKGEHHSNAEVMMHRKDTDEYWLGEYSYAPLLDQKHQIIGAVVTARDLTERRQEQALLQEQESMLKEMSNMAHVGAWKYDPATGSGSWTEETARIHDLDPEHATDKSFGLHFFHGEHRRKLEAALEEAEHKGTPYDLELQMVSAKGAKKWIRTICRPKLVNGKVILMQGTFQDITRQKEHELQLQESNTRHGAILETAMDGFIVADRTGHIIEVNQAYLDLSGYSREELLGRSITSLHANEPEKDVLMRLMQLQQSGRARFETEHNRKDGSAWPVEMSVTCPPDLGFRSFAFLHDISKRKDQEQKIAEYIKILEESVEDTLLAVSNMIEQRDPYTAGHERRVGLLARDIALAMGWTQEQAHNLFLAGLVHDIGKISVPAEILSKPGRLTQLEYDLVKDHVQIGFEILKDIRFPFPLAEIIHQHHERLDGTGYPQKLKGDEILPEARILTVADILESMSSHRPYRSALGLERAMAELEANRGKYYDPDIIDTVSRMISDEEYRLPM